MPLYVPKEEELLHPSPDSYYNGVVGHTPHQEAPLWIKIGRMSIFGILISVFAYLISR